jgi:hypothetical protein
MAKTMQASIALSGSEFRVLDWVRMNEDGQSNKEIVDHFSSLSRQEGRLSAVWVDKLLTALKEKGLLWFDESEAATAAYRRRHTNESVRGSRAGEHARFTHGVYKASSTAAHALLLREASKHLTTGKLIQVGEALLVIDDQFAQSERCEQLEHVVGAAVPLAIYLMKKRLIFAWREFVSKLFAEQKGRNIDPQSEALDFPRSLLIVPISGFSAYLQREAELNKQLLKERAEHSAVTRIKQLLALMKDRETPSRWESYDRILRSILDPTKGIYGNTIDEWELENEIRRLSVP